MPNDKSRKLESIPDEQFAELIKLGANPVRPDSEIDRDERVVPYDTWLISNGFKYVHTSLGKYGGSRTYNHPSGVSIYVGRWENDILWAAEQSSNGKILAEGKGLELLISKLS